jgi:hypothetical protein
MPFFNTYCPRERAMAGAEPENSTKEEIEKSIQAMKELKKFQKSDKYKIVVLKRELDDMTQYLENYKKDEKVLIKIIHHFLSKKEKMLFQEMDNDDFLKYIKGRV